MSMCSNNASTSAGTTVSGTGVPKGPPHCGNRLVPKIRNVEEVRFCCNTGRAAYLVSGDVGPPVMSNDVGSVDEDVLVLVDEGA